MKTKEELEKAIIMHEEALESSKHSVIVDQQDLELAKKELKDMNKPVLTAYQFDQLHEAVEKGVGDYDFSDEDNFDCEFGINYDGKVHLENFDISNSQDLIEKIVEELNKMFVEVEDEDNDQVDR